MKKYFLTAVSILIIVTANAQWRVQNAGYINDTLGFYEMSLPNAHTVWAISYDGKSGLNRGRFILDFTRTTNGGATWMPGKMGTDHTLQFSNISAISEDEAWVAMNKRFATGGGLFHTTDGGITWTQSGVGEIFDENSFPNFVHFKDKNHGVAMGDPNGGYFEIYTTSNGGKKWKRVPQTNIPPVVTNEFGWISGYAALNNTIWFGTYAGRMYKSENFGKDWTVSVVDPDGKFINEIAFNDDMLHGVAHLRDNPGNTFLYSTADGGLTWTNLGQPLNWKSSRITAVPGTNALVATSVNGFDKGSSVSYDNGATWTVIENTAPKAVARFYDANTGYAGGYFVTGPPLRGGIFKSEIAFQLPANRNSNTSSLQSSTASDNNAGNLVKVYPFPAKSVINVSLENELNKSESIISIISMQGGVLQSVSSNGAKNIQVNVSKLPAGMYILRIESAGKTINKIISIAR